MEANIEMNLQLMRDGVARIIEKESDIATNSSIWQGCVNVLSYLLEVSPKNLRNIRLHTEIFSGEFLNFILFNASAQNPLQYAEGLGYTFATEGLAKKYWISEPPIWGWISEFGCKYEDVIVNPEIARYQLYIENFVQTGMLTQIETSSDKTVVMEIGAGYGAIGHALFNIAPKKVCYIVLDLPFMLLFTGCYIATHHPDAKIFLYDPDNAAHQELDESILDYDLVLIPNHKLSILNKLSKVHYAINTISMAEMTQEQVQDYINFIRPRLVNYFFFQNYAWSYPEPVHELVGKSFFARPNLHFFDNYVADNKLDPGLNTLKSFYFTTSPKEHEKLAACQIKLRLPDFKSAQLNLSDETLKIRIAANKYVNPGLPKLVKNKPIKSILKKVYHKIKSK